MNKKIISIIVLVIIIVVGIVYYSGKTEIANTSPIKIGALFAQTGKMAAMGETELNFAKMAISEINATGGIKGRQIELIAEDDMGSAKDAVSATNKLMAQGIKIILGPSSGVTTPVVLPVTMKNGVIIFADTTSVKGLFDNSKYSFRTTPVSTDSASKIAFLARNKYKIDTVSMITEQTEFAKSWSVDFKNSFELLGGKVLINEEYVSNTTDFKTSILKVKDSNAQAVFVSAQSAQPATAIIKQMSELGVLSKVQLIGNPSVVEASVASAVGEIFPANAFTVLPSSENAELLAKYRQTYKAEPGYQFFLSAATYDSVYILKAAIEKCGENNDCIDSYIKTDLKDFKGSVAVWNFNKNGDPVLGDTYFKELNIIKGAKVFTPIVK